MLSAVLVSRQTVSPDNQEPELPTLEILNFYPSAVSDGGHRSLKVGARFQAPLGWNIP